MVQLDDRFSVSQLAFTRARVQRVTAEVRHTGTQAGGQDGKVGRQVGRWNVGIFASHIRGRGISGFYFWSWRVEGRGHRGYIGSGKSVLWLSGERSGGGGRVEEGATDGRKRNSHTAPVDPIRSNSSMLADFVRPPACSGTPGPTCSEKDFMQIIGGGGGGKERDACVCVYTCVCMYVRVYVDM